jgi:predicted nucleic acid-binding protein
MKVVADTSVLIALAAAGHLNLLQKMWEVIFIPDAVYTEVKPARVGHAAVDDAVKQGWIVKLKASIPSLVSMPAWMGQGETECLLLAKEINASLILMDEIRGRRAMLSNGFKVTGSVGIVDRALEMGLLERSELPGILNAWAKINFRISDKLLTLINI